MPATQLDGLTSKEIVAAWVARAVDGPDPCEEPRDFIDRMASQILNALCDQHLLRDPE